MYSSRDQETMVTLYKSLIRSHLEYCCPIWHPSKICEIEAVESLQREFTRRINGCQAINYWDRLKRLKLLLQRRRERYIILTMWKILHGNIPNDINVQFRPESRLGIQAIIPSLPRNCSISNKTLYDSFLTFLMA